MGKSIIANYGTIAAVDNGSYFIPISGSIRGDNAATEAHVELPIRTAGVIRKMRCWVASNTATVSSTLTFRKNAVDTALVATITSDGVGLFADNDLGHEVSIAANDKVCVRLTIPSETGTNTLTITGLWFEFEPTDSSITMQLFANAGDNPGLTTDSATRWMGANGPTAHGLSEATVKYRIETSCTIRSLYTYVISNPRTTDVVVRTRKNGGNGTQVVTYTSGQTGVKEDLVNTDSFAAGDDFNFQTTTLTGGGSIVFAVQCVEVVSTNRTFPFCVAINTAVAQAANTTDRVGVHGDLNHLAAAENDAEIDAPFAFQLSKLHVYYSALANALGSTVVTLVKGGIDTGMLITVAAGGAIGLKSESSPIVVDVALAETLSFKSVNNDTVSTVTKSWIGMLATTPASSTIVPIVRYRRVQQGVT